MRHAHERLKWARERAGYNSAWSAAEALGIPAPTYHNHENGNRKFSHEKAEIYARKFKVPVAWLAFGAGPKPEDAPDEVPLQVPARDPMSGQMIRELDVRAGAGGGGVVAQVYGFSDGENITDPVKDHWQFPKSFVSGQLGVRNGHLDIIEVLGDSMEPKFSSGDKVVVDTSHKNPWPDGIYVIWDGFGVIVKRVELVRGRERPTIRCISDNKNHSDFEITLDDAHIIGRVVAHISTRV